MFSFSVSRGWLESLPRRSPALVFVFAPFALFALYVQFVYVCIAQRKKVMFTSPSTRLWLPFVYTSGVGVTFAALCRPSQVLSFFFHIHSVDLVRSCLLRYGHGNFSSGLLLRHAQCALIDPNHSNYIRLFFPPIFCFSREPFAKTTKCPSRRARKVRLPKAPIQMARQQQRTWGQRRRG